MLIEWISEWTDQIGMEWGQKWIVEVVLAVKTKIERRIMNCRPITPEWNGIYLVLGSWQWHLWHNFWKNVWTSHLYVLLYWDVEYCPHCWVIVNFRGCSKWSLGGFWETTLVMTLEIYIINSTVNTVRVLVLSLTELKYR